MRRARDTTRREALAIGWAAVAVSAAHPLLTSPARAATDSERAEALRAFAGDAELRDGRVTLDLPPLVENGNAAPLTVSVDSPMTETDYVRRIAVFNERNPEPSVITVQLGPWAGRAEFSTRIRLAGSQRITAIAEMSDGSYWASGADVIVTLAACVEG